MTAPGPRARNPDRAVVERVAAEEARRARIPVAALLGNGERQAYRIVQARRRAFARILTETSCSARGLATVWGFSASEIRRARRMLGAHYDTATFARLTWLYGAWRARRIVRGADTEAAADLRRWRELGHRVAA